MQLRLDFLAHAPSSSIAMASPPTERRLSSASPASMPAHLETAPVSTPRPPEVYTRAEIEPLLAACPPTVFGARHRALIVVLWRSGLRISEAIGLRVDDLDRRAGTIYVRRGKGGHPRIVSADADTFAVVDEWLACRRAHNVPAHAPLFCSLDGSPVIDASVRRTLAALGKRAGLLKRVHPHGFRHTHAAELWREGIPERLIQVQLGHRSLDTTGKYLTRIGSTDDLVAMGRGRAPWRARVETSS